MNSKIQHLIHKLNESFQGTPWFGDSLMPTLKAIDYKLVNKKLTNSNNSIAILVQHLINWRVFAIEKLEGNQCFDIELNSEKDWTKITIENENEWNELLKELISTQRKIISILDSQKVDSFLTQITLGKSYNFEYLIEGVLQHDIYHFGQIGLLYAHLKFERK